MKILPLGLWYQCFMGEFYVSKIAELREAKGLTQNQLAALIGVDPSTLRNWESGRNGLRQLVSIAKLCEALDVAPGQLVQIDQNQVS